MSTNGKVSAGSGRGSTFLDFFFFFRFQLFLMKSGDVHRLEQSMQQSFCCLAGMHGMCRE